MSIVCVGVCSEGDTKSSADQYDEKGHTLTGGGHSWPFDGIRAETDESVNLQPNTEPNFQDVILNTELRNFMSI